MKTTFIAFSCGNDQGPKLNDQWRAACGVMRVTCGVGGTQSHAIELFGELAWGGFFGNNSKSGGVRKTTEVPDRPQLPIVWRFFFAPLRWLIRADQKVVRGRSI